MGLALLKPSGKQVELPAQLRPPNLHGVLFCLMLTFAVIACSLSFALGPLTIFGCAVFVLLMAALGTRDGSPWTRSYPSMVYLMVVFVGTILLATYVGIRIYIIFYVPYYFATSGEKYEDVSVHSKAGKYGDAGIIKFNNDAALDGSRSFGLKSYDGTYCVAPIISAKDSVHPNSVGSKITFWATGKNCCSNRGNFECDGAGDIDVHSAFVAHDAAQEIRYSGMAPTKGWVTDLLTPRTHRSKYLKAAESACTLHNMRCDLSEDEVLLLRWTAAPEEILRVWHLRAVIAIVVACVVYGVCTMFLWTGIHYYVDKEVRRNYGPLGKAYKNQTLGGKQADSAARSPGDRKSVV